MDASEADIAQEDCKDTYDVTWGIRIFLIYVYVQLNKMLFNF